MWRWVSVKRLIILAQELSQLFTVTGMLGGMCRSIGSMFPKRLTHAQDTATHHITVSIDGENTRDNQKRGILLPCSEAIKAL